MRIGRLPIATLNFCMPFKIALVPGKWSELACQCITRHAQAAINEEKEHTILNITSATEARAAILSGSSSDAITVRTSSCSRSFALARDRTDAVIAKVSAFGCFNKRLSTEPPT